MQHILTGLIVLAASSCLNQKKPQIQTKSPGINKSDTQTSGPDISLRVVGGSEVSEREIPFIVSIQRKDGRGGWYHMCGGSLLSQDAVLTAGHCLAESSENLISPDDLTIVAGVNDLKSGKGERLKVKNIVIHPQFLKSLQTAESSELISLAASGSGLEPAFFAPLYGYDLGIIQLSQKPDFSEGLSGKVLPDLKNDSLLSASRISALQGPVFHLAGWGITERRPVDELLRDASQFDHQKTSSRLKTGKQPVISTESCRDLLMKWFRKKLGFAYAWLGSNVKKTIDQTMNHIVCAGTMTVGATSFCSGDSGGPLFYRVPDSGPRIAGAMVSDSRPTMIQTGIVSFSLGCNTEGIPDLYTKVADFSDWIDTVTNEPGRK